MDVVSQQNHDSALMESSLFINKTHNEADSQQVGAPKKSSIRKDIRTIVFLMYMYFLQGIPLGLNGAIPLILGARKVGFSGQGTFSFAFWPFSIKLLWAPIVDSLYFKRMGRRRSWIVPVNFLIAMFMFGFADLANNLLDTSQSQAGNSQKKLNLKFNRSSLKIFTLKEMVPLAFIFMLMTFLAATQDIIVT
jgi:PAT family acetyl-CoA transporter-like MFS transporter 1